MMLGEDGNAESGEPSPQRCWDVLSAGNTGQTRLERVHISFRREANFATDRITRTGRHVHAKLGLSVLGVPVRPHARLASQASPRQSEHLGQATQTGFISSIIGSLMLHPHLLVFIFISLKPLPRICDIDLDRPPSDPDQEIQKPHDFQSRAMFSCKNLERGCRGRCATDDFCQECKVGQAVPTGWPY